MVNTYSPGRFRRALVVTLLLLSSLTAATVASAPPAEAARSGCTLKSYGHTYSSMYTAGYTCTGVYTNMHLIVKCERRSYIRTGARSYSVVTTTRQIFSATAPLATHFECRRGERLRYSTLNMSGWIQPGYDTQYA